MNSNHNSISSSFNLKRYLVGPHKIERWLIVGNQQEYILTNSSCSCQHFMVQALKSSEKRCKHLKKLEDAKQTSNYDTYEIEFEIWKILRPFLFKKQK